MVFCYLQYNTYRLFPLIKATTINKTHIPCNPHCTAFWKEVMIQAGTFK